MKGFFAKGLHFGYALFELKLELELHGEWELKRKPIEGEGVFGKMGLSRGGGRRGSLVPCGFLLILMGCDLSVGSLFLYGNL